MTDRLLADIASELRRFVALLAEEKSALIAGDAQRLPALSAEKSALAERLGALDDRRGLRLRAQGFDNDKPGIAAWLSGQSPANAALWREILRLATLAKETNDLNGTLIDVQAQQTRQAVATLLGELAATYDASGQQHPATRRRPLGSA
jgi:flagella synthesis protein FlgN